MKVTLAIWTPPSIQRSAGWLRWPMMLMRLRLWAQICQWTLCQGWGSLLCVTKEHPGQYSLCGPVLSDKTAISRMEAVMAMGSRRTRAGAWLTIPTPGETIQSSVLLLPAMGVWYNSHIQFANHPMVYFGESQPLPLLSTTMGRIEAPACPLSRCY